MTSKVNAKIWNALIISIFLKMKKALLLIFAAASLPIAAQNSLLEEATRHREDNSWLIKWGAAALLPAHSTTYFRENAKTQFPEIFNPRKPLLAVAAEGTLTKNWSLQMDVAATPKPTDFTYLYLRTSAELRRYWGFVQLERQQARGDNFSGFYTALQFAVFQSKAKTSQFDIYNPDVDQQMTTARLGFQTRFLRNGFFDFSLGFGRQVERWLHGLSGSEYRFDKSFLFDPRLSFGLAMGDFSKTKIRHDLRNQIFKKDEKRLAALKIDLLRIARLEENSTWSGRPSLEAEVKFGRSEFSATTELAIPFSSKKEELGMGLIQKTREIGFAPAVELRWYFSQTMWQPSNRRNFNGLFFGANYVYELLFLPNAYRQLSRRTTFLVGAQSRVFDQGFVQFKIGLGKTGQDIWQRDQPWRDKFAARHLLSELKAGLIF